MPFRSPAPGRGAGQDRCDDPATGQAARRPNHESAGKQKRRGTRKGNTFPTAALVTAAISAARTKGTYLRDKFHRLKTHMGTKKAAMAVAHKILIAAFSLLRRGVEFAELGADYLDCVNKHSSPKRLVRRLDALRYDVMLRPKMAMA